MIPNRRGDGEAHHGAGLGHSSVGNRGVKLPAPLAGVFVNGLLLLCLHPDGPVGAVKVGVDHDDHHATNSAAKPTPMTSASA
jgi:hypothetical protein